MKGKVLDLSSSSLTLFSDGRRVDLHESDVAKVVETHNNPGKGARYGLAAGAALGALTGLVYGSGCHVDCSAAGYALGYAGLFGGLGAALGTGIGAATLTHHVLYKKSGSSDARLTISPVVTRDRKGVSMAMQF
jgi:hypothetical protein